MERAQEVFDPVRLANTVAWLEEEQRSNREQFAAIRQQMQRFQGFLEEQAEYAQFVEGALNTLRQQLGRLPIVEEIASQTRDQVHRIETLQGDLEKGATHFQRIAENEVEGLRVTDAELQHEQRELRVAIEALERRITAWDEGERRRQDGLARVEQRYVDLAKVVEAADTRSRSVAEQLKRNRDEIEQMSAHLGSLVGQDELLSNRLQVLAEQIKTIDDKIDAAVADMEEFRPLSDRIDVHRAETHRMHGEITSLAQNYSHFNERIDDIARQVRETTSRNRESFDKMMALRQEVWEYAQQTQEQVVQLLRLQERQRRREITEMEQQVKELRSHKAFTPEKRPHD